MRNLRTSVLSKKEEEKKTSAARLFPSETLQNPNFTEVTIRQSYEEMKGMVETCDFIRWKSKALHIGDFSE